MSQYQTGVVDVTNGSATVAGLGTVWTTNVTVGDLFMVRDIYTHYQVASIPNNTSLVLNSAWAGSTLTGQTYQIVRDFTPNYDFIEINPGDKNWAFNITANLRSIDLLLSSASSDYVVVDHGTATTVNLATSDFNKVHLFQNTSECDVTLPAVDIDDVGVWFKFRKKGTGSLIITVAAGDYIMDDNTIIANETEQIWGSLEICLEEDGYWGVLSMLGNWETSS